VGQAILLYAVQEMIVPQRHLLKWAGLHARSRPETVILSLSKDDILSKTALFDKLRVLVLRTTVAVVGYRAKTGQGIGSLEMEEIGNGRHIAHV